MSAMILSCFIWANILAMKASDGTKFWSSWVRAQVGFGGSQWLLKKCCVISTCRLSSFEATLSDGGWEGGDFSKLDI